MFLLHTFRRRVRSQQLKFGFRKVLGSLEKKTWASVCGVDRLFRKYSFEVLDEEEEAAAAAESEENALGVEFLVAPFACALASLAVSSAIFFLELFRGKRNNFVNRTVWYLEHLLARVS